MHRPPSRDQHGQIAVVGRLLLEAGWFSLDREMDLRGRTSLAFHLFTAPPTRVLPKLRIRHWCFDRRDLVDLDADGHYRASTDKHRQVAVVPTLKALGSAYLACTGKRPRDGFFFVGRDGEPIGKKILHESMEAACRHIGAPGAVTLGDAALLMRRRLLDENRADGLAEYLLGTYRCNRRSGKWNVGNPPPPALARDFIASAVPFAEPPPDLLAHVTRSWEGARRPPPRCGQTHRAAPSAGR